LRWQRSNHRHVEVLWAYSRCTTRGAEIIKKRGISVIVFQPLVWNVVFVEDSLYWASWLTCTTVYALIRVDVEHTLAFIDAVYWAFFNTTPV